MSGNLPLSAGLTISVWNGSEEATASDQPHGIPTGTAPGSQDNVSQSPDVRPATLPVPQYSLRFIYILTTTSFL
ncbi:MAG: hypothetical protein HUU02_05340 [Bacteroidetes bacterium]|nr:hypothetical protein [Bacteroidota bacterium]